MLDRHFWSYRRYSHAQGLRQYEPAGEIATILPREVYRYIENWWGDSFDEQLIKRIAHAPIEHRIAFGLSLRVDCSPVAVPNGLLPVVPESIVRGGPRLVSESGEGLLTALRLLLYAQEVVIAQERLPLPHVQVIDRDDDDFPGFFAREEHVEAELTKLMQIRALVESDQLQFGKLSQGAGFFETSELWGQLLGDNQAEALLKQHTIYQPEWLRSRDPTIDLRLQAGGVLSALNLVTEVGGQIVALSDIEEYVRDRLLGAQIGDRRLMVVERLAALRVPEFFGNLENLVEIRQSEESFAEWRKRLADSVGALQGLGRSEDGLVQASQIIHDNLMDGLIPIQGRVRRSSALTAASQGVRGFAISGVSAATTGLITGNPWVALASGATGKIADSIVQYFENRKSARSDQLLLDLALSFKPNA